FPIDKRIGAEAREVRDFIREVRVVPFAEFLAVRFGHDRREQAAQVRHAEDRRRGVERLYAPVLSDQRRRSDAQMQVRRTGADHPMKQLIDRIRLAQGSGTSLMSTMWAALTSSFRSPVSR